MVKTFDGFRAVDGIDLEVRQGKTTTLKMLATLLPIDAGQASVFGVDSRASRIGSANCSG